MKKKLALIFALLTVLLMVAGCGGNNGEKNYTLVSDIAEDGKSMSITANKADEGDFTMGGTLIIEANEKVACEPAMDKGSVTIELIPSEDLGLSEDADAEDIEGAADATAAFSFKAIGSDIEEETPDPGEYYVRVTADKGATGTVTLTVAQLK